MSSIALDVIGFLWACEKGSLGGDVMGIQLVAINETEYNLINK